MGRLLFYISQWKPWVQLRFLKAYLALVADPTRTDQVFVIKTLKRHDNRATEPVIARASADAAFQKLFQEKYFPGRVDLAQLSRLPEGTFGRAYAKHMSDHGLDPNFFPPNEAESLIGYISLRAKQVHDIWHVLGDYRTDVADEVALQAFTLGQMHSGLSASIVSGGILHLLDKEPLGIAHSMELICEGYARGRDAVYLLGVRIEELFERDLEELRQQLKIAPRKHR